MTLKDNLEILHGEPIKVYAGDPLDIPCIETSDWEKLCKHPVVSINMITYNHEPYIRQAIEGVMMQKTDFEFELVIGEDCSQDKTREICFEYQRKYPDKIRVLWWHENVSKLGGNNNRVTARCRGEFVAYCEGDDYWTDPLKLQKQVRIIRDSQSIGAVAFNKILSADGSIADNVYTEKKFIDSQDFFDHYFHTSTYIFKRAELQRMRSRYKEIPYWHDVMLFYCMSDMGKVSLLPEVVSVRRVTGNGVATSLSSQGRAILLLKEYIPLYLWGPKNLRRLFEKGILSSIPLFFYKRGQGYSEQLTRKLGKPIFDIFWIVFKNNLVSHYAWGRLLRIFKYYWFAGI